MRDFLLREAFQSFHKHSWHIISYKIYLRPLFNLFLLLRLALMLCDRIRIFYMDKEIVLPNKDLEAFQQPNPRSKRHLDKRILLYQIPGTSAKGLILDQDYFQAVSNLHVSSSLEPILALPLALLFLLLRFLILIVVLIHLLIPVFIPLRLLILLRLLYLPLLPIRLP